MFANHSDFLVLKNRHLRHDVDMKIKIPFDSLFFADLRFPAGQFPKLFLLIHRHAPSASAFCSESVPLGYRLFQSCPKRLETVSILPSLVESVAETSSVLFLLSYSISAGLQCYCIPSTRRHLPKKIAFRLRAH